MTQYNTEKIHKHKPDIFVINEVELSNEQDIEILNIDGYNVETDNLRETQGNIRTVIYIKQNLNYTRYKKYECKDE